MSHEYDSGTGHINVQEVVVDWSDLGAVALSETLHAEVYQTTETVITYDLMRINAIKTATASASCPPATDPMPPPGSYSVSESAAGDGVETFSAWTADTTIRPNGGGSTQDFMPLTAAYEQTITPSVAEYRFAVDYRDNVPVYGYHVMPAGTRTASIAATTTQDGAAHASASSTFDAILGQTAGDNAYDISLDGTVDGTLDDVISGTNSGIRCPRSDTPADGDWLAITPAYTRSGARSASAVFHQLQTWTADSYPGTGATSFAEGSYDSTTTRDDEADLTTLTLLHLDLRNRSAAYVVKQAVSSSTETKTASGSDSDTNTADDFSAADPTITKGGSRTETLDVTYDTTVRFDDTDVQTFSGGTTSSTTPAGDSGTFALHTISPIEALDYLCVYSGAPIPPLTDATLYSTTFPGTIDLQSASYPDLDAGTDATADNVDLVAEGNVTTIDLSRTTATAIPIDVATGDASFIEYRLGWAYSLPRISGTPYDPTDWDQAISHGDFDTLTGHHSADRIINYWVLSACAIAVEGQAPLQRV
jgi:hypothetical protein